MGSEMCIRDSYTNWLNYYVYQTTPYDLSTEQSFDDPFEDFEK